MTQLDGRLVVVEEPTRFLVAREQDPSDWLCAFERGGEFPARHWAEAMVRTWNARVSSASSRRPPAASAR